jgi:hypothetical protein
MRKKFLFNPVIMFLIMIGFFSNPAVSSAAGSVLINEIAWMGTAASASDEWIELYNSSSSEIDLAGWNLYEGGDVLIVALSGKISAGGYYLIERTNDDTVKDITADLAHSFGGSGLNNSGENLVLKNSSGEIVDSADLSYGWPAGDSASKSTMERKSDGMWQTNDGITKNGNDADGNPINGTPKSANSSGASSSVPAETQSDSQPVSSGSGSGSGSSMPSETKILEAEAGPDVFIEKGKPIALNGLSSIGAESYKWYLGDGTIKDDAEITYTYQFPGTYLVTLEVRCGEKTSIDQLRVFVFGGKAVINEFFIGNSSTTGTASNAAGGWIEINNPNSETLDLSRWILSTGNKNFIIPEFVIIPKGGFLVFPQQVTELDILSSNKISIKYPNGIVADEVSFEKNIQGYSANRASEGFFWSKEITPGRQNIVLPSGKSISDLPPAAQNNVVLKPDENAKNYIASFYSSVENPKEQLAQASVEEVSGGFMDELFGNVVFWVITIIIFGIFSSMFYFRLIKR